MSEVRTLLTVANTKHKTTKLEQCVGKQPVHLSLLTLRLCTTNSLYGVRHGGNWQAQVKAFPFTWHIVLLLTAAPALIRHTIGCLLSPELQGSQSSASPGPHSLLEPTSSFSVLAVRTAKTHTLYHTQKHSTRRCIADLLWSRWCMFIFLAGVTVGDILCIYIFTLFFYYIFPYASLSPLLSLLP